MPKGKTTKCIDCGATLINVHGLVKRCRPCHEINRRHRPNPHAKRNSKRRYDKLCKLNLCACGRSRVNGRMRCAICIAGKKAARQARIKQGVCASCGNKLDGKGKECIRCSTRRNASVKKCYAPFRQAILDHYGRICRCCGENTECLLTLDHMLNNGAEHRRSLGNKGSYHLYKEVIKTNFPATYQILCYNCNIGKHLNKGRCPHEDLRLALVA